MEKIKINFIKQLLFIVILLVGLSVKAQVKKQFTPRYNSTLTGDVTIIANNMLSRTATGNYNGNGDNHTFTNNVYVDIDNDNTTFNSSSANLSNPRPNDPCLQIEKVLLYWAAADRGIDLPNGNQTDNQPNWNYNDVKLMLPGQTSYTTITADDVIYRGRDENPLINNDPYVCVKDITNSVNNLSNPFGKFQVANVEAKTGFLISHENTNTGTSGGWQIIMVYKSENLKTRNITLFDGYANVTSSQNNFNIDVSGFQTVPNGSVKADIVIGALEGDRSLSGDRLQIRNTFNNFVDIDAPQRNTFNFFNSRITVGNNNFTDRNPASLNTLGFDASVFSLSNNGNNILDNNQTSATFRLTSNQETYGLFALGFSVEVYEPIIQTIFTASPINITPGNTPQTVNYSANISNIGNDNANNVSLSTVIPLGSELTLPITGLTSGITYNYDNNSRVLTFIIDNGLLDTSESLDLQYQTTINDQCYYLTNNCSDVLESNLVAYYSGELNIKDFVSNSSNDVDECNIGNNLNTIVTVNAPAEATWITNANDLDRTIECNDTNALNSAQALFPQASCSGLTVIKTSGPFVSSSNCPTIGTYTNTWNFTDSCGRTISNYVQTITIEDTTPPNFDSTLPNDITVTSENIPNVPTVTATDNCGEAVVSFSEIETGNICDGSYTITRTWIATDECNLTVSHTQTITVTQPVLSASIVSITDVLCNSEATGSIDISVTGGTAPYSYIWNDTNNTTTQDLNNVIAGAYNVTITDANGCTTTISDTISEPATPLSLNITKVDATSAQGCNDGQATAIVSGGTAGYTYLWSTSANNQTTATANNLSEGTHSVTITDANGCQITQSIVILCVNTCDAEINIDTITNVLCTNESTGAATVSASSDANPNATFTFTWSNGQINAGVTSSTLDNQSAGVYSVSVTIDGTVCQAVEETISITEPSNALDVTAVTTDESGPATGDGTATATATGGVQPYQYTWSPDGQNTNQITGLSAGNYTVTVTDANGCTDTVTVTVNPGSCNNLS
ncbi:SprB repeat-containing protein, partial [uncultured Olleya sp.]|uniref:SprB repeat-containing protein n=1 Tax=uncultured Olleya sp. TaxID=757243 RepID=UPI002599DFF1